MKKVILYLEEIRDYFYYYCWKNPKRISTNLIYFFKVVYNYRDFDYTYNFDLFIHSLERTADAIDKRKIIQSHKEHADSIKNFIRLYKKLRDDDYIEEAGCNWDNINFKFTPITNSDCFAMSKESTYTKEEMEKFHEDADILRSKDFEEMINEFKKYQRWWD